MTRATYNATDGTLTELPGMEKPLIKDYVRVVRRPFGEVDSFTDSKYYEDLKKYEAELAKCRTIPCSPECCGLWAEGQKLEEGRDYEVHPICGRKKPNCGKLEVCDQCTWLVVPLPIKSEAPFLWTDELVKEYAEQYRFSSSRISIEQFKYSLTKR